MRTVDPAQWSKRVVKPPIDVAWPWRYRVEVMSGFERRLRRSFRDAMAELLRNCSMEGVSSIVDKRNPRPIRWCYCVLLLSTVAGCALVTCSDLAGMSGWPRVVAVLQAAPHPVQHVDFPAVALCSYNTVSAAALDSYANYLYSLEKNNTYSMESLKRNLIAFSGLITASSQVSFDSNFTKFLAEVARETNVTNIIYKLSPKCESMLVRCSWRGHRTHCGRLFAMRITDVGYCCVFNARYSLEDRHNLPFRVNMAGQDYGLSVVVKENTDDFTYVRRAGEEIEMLVFDGTQYPLVRAGVVRAFPVPRNASVFVTLRAAAQRAAHSLRFYTEAWRGCVMSYADGRPGHSWVRCVAECRMRAVRALCRCTPYTKPLRNHTDRDIGNQVTCSLEHLACLDKHKEKLTYFYPGDNAHESLSEEREDSVECLHCRPNCARLRYAARVWHVPYGDHINKMFANNFVEGVQLANATVLRVYFTAEDQRLHLVEPYMSFYEHICFLSSQWVFLVGLTVTTCTELIYHCTVRWRHHYRRRRRRELNQPIIRELAEMKKIKKGQEFFCSLEPKTLKNLHRGRSRGHQPVLL